MKKLLEKIVTGIITCSGFITSLIILLIVLFLFSEGFGLFSQKTIEDGYVLVVNKNNPVNELNAKQIKEIFDEDITNWKEVGGQDERIMPFRLDDMQKYFTEEELGDEYVNADKCIDELVNEHSGIVAFIPDAFINDKFTGKKLQEHQTSAMDNLTEENVMKSVMQKMKDKTVIAIAHRLNSIAGFDRIILFKEGRIVGQGTFEELLHTDSYFMDLYNANVK